MEIKHLYKRYGKLSVFEDFNLGLEEQKITAILGPSGCGKTTLLRLLAGLERPDRGHIIFEHPEQIGMIFQEDRLLPWLSTYDNLMYVLKSHMTAQQAHIRIEYVLRALKLWEFRDYMPDTLSGGMQRRVAIGRAFVYPSTVLIMDEPFKGLDAVLRQEIMESIKKMWQENQRTIIFVTHQKEEAEYLAHFTYEFESSIQ